MLVSDETLDGARTALEQLHVTTATLTRLTETIAADGSVTKAWAAAGSIPCRVETDMGDRTGRMVAGTAPGDRPVYEFTVFAAHDADLRRGDRLTLPSGIVLSVMQASRGQSQAIVSAYGCSEVG